MVDTRPVLVLIAITLLLPLTVSGAQPAPAYELKEVWSKYYGGYVTGLAWLGNDTVLVGVDGSGCRGVGRLLAVNLSTNTILWGVGLVGGAYGIAVVDGVAVVASGPKIHGVSISEKRVVWSHVVGEGEGVSVSPGPRGLVVFAAGPALYMYNATTGGLEANTTIDGQAAAVAWSPRGIAVGTRDGRLILLNSSLGKEWETQALGGIVTSIAWNPSNTLIAVGTGFPARTLAVYNATTGSPVEIKAPGMIAGVAWLNDTSLLVAVYDKASLYIYSLGKDSTRRIELPFKPSTLAYNPATGRAVVGGMGEIRVIDIETAAAYGVYIGEPPVSVAYSSGYDLLAVAWGKAVTVYGLDGAEKWAQVLREKVEAVSWSPDGEYLAVGSGRSAYIYDYTGRHVSTVNATSTVKAVAWLGEGIVVATRKGVEAYSLGGEKLWSLEAKHVLAIATAPDKGLVWVGLGYPARIEAIANGSRVWAGSLHADTVRALVFNRDMLVASIVKANGTSLVSRIAALSPNGTVVWSTPWEKGAGVALAAYDDIVVAGFSEKIEGKRLTRDIGWLVVYNATSGEKLGESSLLNCPPRSIALINTTHIAFAEAYKGLRLAVLLASQQSQPATTTTPSPTAQPNTTTTAPATPTTTVISVTVPSTATTTAVAATTVVYHAPASPSMPPLLLYASIAGIVVIVVIVVILLVLGRQR